LAGAATNPSIIQGSADTGPTDGSSLNDIEALVQQLLQRGVGFPTSMTTRTLRRGQHLYWPGGLSKHLYSIKRGTVKTYRTGTDGRERISGFHSTGQLLGLDTLVERPMRCGAIAVDTSVIRQIPVQALLDGALKSGPLWHHLLEELDNEIARLENRLAVCCLPAAERLADFILSMANSSGEAYLPMSHREIGNFLRLVPETVSRLLTKFHQRGWLSIAGRELVICNRNALEQAAAGHMPQ
jgi:CRP/FNR family transcriptional regulator